MITERKILQNQCHSVQSLATRKQSLQEWDWDTVNFGQSAWLNARSPVWGCGQVFYTSTHTPPMSCTQFFQGTREQGNKTIINGYTIIVDKWSLQLVPTSPLFMPSDILDQNANCTDNVTCINVPNQNWDYAFQQNMFWCLRWPSSSSFPIKRISESSDLSVFLRVVSVPGHLDCSIRSRAH